MPRDGDASASNKSKAKKIFYLSEGKKNKKRRLGNVPSFSCSCKSKSTSKKHGTQKKRGVLQRSIEIQTLIGIGTIRLKMPPSLTLKLQTPKTGFKLRTRLHLENDGPR